MCWLLYIGKRRSGQWSSNKQRLGSIQEVFNKFYICMCMDDKWTNGIPRIAHSPCFCNKGNTGVRGERENWSRLGLHYDDLPWDSGIYLTEESIPILEHNSDKIRTMFRKSWWGGDEGWTWRWHFCFPLQEYPPSLSWWSAHGPHIPTPSLYPSGGQTTQLGQWEHFIPLTHGDGFSQRRPIQARPMRLSSGLWVEALE